MAGESARESARRQREKAARLQRSAELWERGADGERATAAALDALPKDTWTVFHDVRWPGRKFANIDHVAVGPSGIFVIDAKRYKGRPRLQVDGGLFRPRTERMFVGSRDCTKLVAGVQWQVELVHTALSGRGVTAPILGKLCFVDADWPLIGGAFTIGGVEALWPKALRKQLARPGPLTPEMLHDLHRHIADAFPPA